MKLKTPNNVSQRTLLITGLSRHQVVWFHWNNKSYIRCLMDGRIMEVIAQDEPFSSACQWVVDCDLKDDERAYAEEQLLKDELLEKFFFPLIVWKQNQLQIAEDERLRLENTVVAETKNLAHVMEKNGFDFSFLETFR